MKNKQRIDNEKYILTKWFDETEFKKKFTTEKLRREEPNFSVFRYNFNI